MLRRPLYAATEVPGPFDDAAARLCGEPATWLPPPATPVDGGGFHVTLRAGRFAPGGVGAVVEVDPAPLVRAGLVIRTLRWAAATADSAFPRLWADLELQELTETAQALALVGSYAPPLSVVGAAADSLVGRHVAEAVGRAFVADVSAALVRAAPTMRR